MKDWYTKWMSPSTAPLGVSLLGHLDLLQDDPAKKFRVVETHCGDARAISYMLPLPSIATYTGCDFSEGMLLVAKKRLEGRGETVQAESSQLPFEAGSFDRYMSNLGCCCVTDLEAKLREARRVLAAGGKAAMSMRIEDLAGDTALSYISSTLRPFGYPAPPTREGLHIGKDPAALAEKVMQAGFTSAKAWQSWVMMPVYEVEEFMTFALSQPAVLKLLASMEESKQMEVKQALEAAGKAAVAQGPMQMAVAVVVAAV